MLNVKALTVALAVAAAIAFIFYVIFGLMMPAEFQSGGDPGSWFPVFPGITFGGFLLGFGSALLLGAITGLLVGTLNNFFHRHWSASH